MPDTPFIEILRDVHKSVRAGHAYSALALALTLPDICGYIEYPQLRSQGQVGERYRRWCDEWARMLVVDGANCYALRCAYLHNGVDEFSGRSGEAASFRRMQFTVATVDGVWSATAQPDGVVRLPYEDFCRDMASAAEGWRRTRSNDPGVVTALNELLRIQPAG